jgi:hypothetical protein
VLKAQFQCLGDVILQLELLSAEDAALLAEPLPCLPAIPTAL